MWKTPCGICTQFAHIPQQVTSHEPNHLPLTGNTENWSHGCLCCGVCKCFVFPCLLYFLPVLCYFAKHISPWDALTP